MTQPRDRILGRAREAVRTQAARPATAAERPLYHPVVDPMQRFSDEFLALKGEILESPERLSAFLARFPGIATDGSDLVHQSVGQPNAEVREADLGVTACECLIAAMGAIVVTPRSAGGRALSVLPPAHLVIARRDQLVPDLASALTLLRQRYDGNWPSTLSIIAGPSRTGDIEKILVMGAHGPKRLAVYWAE